MNEPEYDVFAKLNGLETERDEKAKAQTRFEAKQEFLEQQIAKMLATPETRESMYEILVFCRNFATTHVAGDPYSSAFLAGQQNVGLALMSIIPARVYSQMLIEEEDRRKPEKADARKRKSE